MSCGLKQATGQAYVHVAEDNGGDNVSFMGLLLHRYIPDTAALRQEHWQGIHKFAGPTNLLNSIMLLLSFELSGFCRSCDQRGSVDKLF